MTPRQISAAMGGFVYAAMTAGFAYFGDVFGTVFCAGATLFMVYYFRFRERMRP